MVSVYLSGYVNLSPTIYSRDPRGESYTHPSSTSLCDCGGKICVIDARAGEYRGYLIKFRRKRCQSCGLDRETIEFEFEDFEKLLFAPCPHCRDLRREIINVVARYAGVKR